MVASLQSVIDVTIHLRENLKSDISVITVSSFCRHFFLSSSYGLRDSSVGIVTDYGLDDQERHEFESR
jgi:hypothetical protein